MSEINGSFIVDGSPLGAGKWGFFINFTDYGYAKIDDFLEIIPLSLLTPLAMSSSYAGGKLFVVTGVGLNIKSSLKIDGQ